tara:strand:- start:559 stop:1662 length:1104 start_codon:yes stop_codon:yes gene_type:complete
MPTINAQLVNIQTGEISAASLSGGGLSHLSRAPYAVLRDTGELVVDSSDPILIPDMSIGAMSGSYLTQFNGQFKVTQASSYTLEAKSELTTLYNALMALPVTDATHGVGLGNGETLLTGVYDITGAANVAGTLTLSGSDTDIFVIRSSAAFTTTASSTVVLADGAVSSNVWFVSQGAASTGASSIMKGNIVTNQAAPSLGAGTDLEGRMFAINGAPSLNASFITTPTGTSSITVGSVLEEFSMFAGVGSLSNTGASTISLSVGTNAGTVTGFGTATIGGDIYAGGGLTLGRIYYGIYVDDLLVDNSLRYATIPSDEIDFEFMIVLQSVLTTTAGQVVSVQCYSAIGEMLITGEKSFIMNPVNTPIYL